MINLTELLSKAVEEQASDVFVVAGFPLACKKNGRIIAECEERILPDVSMALIREIYTMAGRDIERLLHSGDDDFSFAIAGLSRFRVSAYKQRGSLAAVIRIVSFGIPDYRAMHIPDEVMAAARYTKGLVLVTGPAGSGKSTTLACMVDAINSERNGHIITLEEPIEYLHRNKMSIVSQREIELDTESYVKSLRACLRQAPNVILVGEMRDYETIKTAMTAAETGHLIISSLHTVGAANTIDRVIDVFPPSQQQQIRVQLSMLLQAVISQQLVPTEDGDIIPVFEIMNVNAAVRNMIRESKIHQLDAVISQGVSDGMRSMDASLLDLYKRGVISRDNALRYAANMDLLAKRL